MESSSKEVGCFNCGQMFLQLGENLHDLRERLCKDCEDRRHESKALAHARFEMWRWQYDRGDNFTQLLYSLIAKSDQFNMWRLKIAFPLEYRAYHEWFNSSEPEKLLEEWRSAYQS